MTTALTLAPPGRSPVARAAVFVWRAWRGLTARHFRYAVWAGVLLGTIQGIGYALFPQVIWWQALVVNGLLPMVVLALVLLLFVAVAAQVATSRVPRWLPYVAAAFLACAVAMAIYVGVGRWIDAGRNLSAAGFATMLALAMREAVQGPLPIALLAALGYMHGLDTWRRNQALRDVLLEHSRLSREAYEARLQALQARVEPQFLFDTLAAVEALYASDPQVGQRLLDDLIVYLRAALPALDEPSSLLTVELTLARTWRDIMLVRRGERPPQAVASRSADPEARMPPMLLLPLVQHAFESGAHSPSAGNDIDISAGAADGRVRIKVTASGTASSPDGDEPATAAVRERLRLLYGAEAALDVCRRSESVTEFTMEFPHEPTDRDHR
ncbi:MAG: histidine kinase [Burkholderiales bacterium]